MRNALMAWENDASDRQENPGGALGLGLATLLIGAALGAAAALLLAPNAGQELRTRAAGVAGSWKEHTAEALAQGRERVISAVEQAQGSGMGETDAFPDKGAVKPV